MRKRLLSALLIVCVFFAVIGTARAASGFTDVDSGAYYAAAVDWAVTNGITAGTTRSTFSPDRICTVSEILTFLQRANGFMPVSVLDAAKPCTRRAAVTYLWQAAGNPRVFSEVSFTDVEPNSGDREAIAWAVENQVTNGTGDGSTFSPDETCTRAQIVTFLYRARDIWEDAANYGKQPSETEDTTMLQIKIEAGGQSFTATLQDNPTSRALLEQLPMTIRMEELNGNEKYFYLPDALPVNSQKPGSIHAGDLMLYGSDCLVLFYESFSSSYSYTRIGSIDDPANLAAALGRGGIDVTFQKN